ncbi:hypothetical protein Tco_1261210 [Tanacetum coccineum]
MEFVKNINKVRVDERTTLLKSLNRVSETIEADSALKATMQTMAKTNTNTSDNITSLAELLRNEKLLETMTSTLSTGTSAIKEVVTEMFNAFKGFYSSTPLGSTTIPPVTPSKDTITIRRGGEFERQVIVWQRPSFHTKGEPQLMTTKEKEPKVAKVDKEPVHEPQDTEPIPITIVRPTTKTVPEAEIIKSSSRPELTDTVLNILPPQQIISEV